MLTFKNGDRVVWIHPLDDINDEDGPLPRRRGKIVELHEKWAEIKWDDDELAFPSTAFLRDLRPEPPPDATSSHPEGT